MFQAWVKRKRCSQTFYRTFHDHCHQYIMEQNDSQVILTVTEWEKDLGVNVDRDLKFTNHAEIVSIKANRLCGMIRRFFSYMNGDMLNSLFKSLVRPDLEYGNTVRSRQGLITRTSRTPRTFSTNMTFRSAKCGPRFRIFP